MYVLAELHVALGFEFKLLKHAAWKRYKLFFPVEKKRYILIAKFA
jgi:hypothetical protein